MISDAHQSLPPLLLLILSLSFPPSTTTTPTPTPPPFTKLYAFGDSYTDTGNTGPTTGPTGYTYASNPPYGMTYFHHPTNRYSDGRLVIDFIAQTLSLPLLPPSRGGGGDTPSGVNFAVAGSTAIEHSFFVKNNVSFDVTPESIGTQLVWFDGMVMGKKKNEGRGLGLEDALIWVGEIGANDYAYTAFTPLSKSLVQNLAIMRVSAFLEGLLTKGAKYIVVQGLPPSGCLTMSLVLAPPDDRDQFGCVQSLNRQSSTHNALLQAKIQSLRQRFPQSMILYADYYSAYSEIIKNPGKYGLKELFKACCGSGGGPYNYEFFSVCGSPSASPCRNPSQYINWDGVHLTEAMNKAVSGLFLQGGYCHPSFQDLLSRKKTQG